MYRGAAAVRADDPNAVTFWRVPREFEGQTVVVMASGPSMCKRDADKVRDAGVPAIVVNETYRLAPWAWMLYAADWKWWARSPKALEFTGHKVSVEAGKPHLPQVKRLRNTGIDGFDPDPSCVRAGNNSGYQAVHIAIHTGAARILLLGFDMRGGHWHGASYGPLRRDWINRFRALAWTISAKVQIINCTPFSALDCFPKMPLDEALAVPVEA
jgi:hypothetical protein